MGNSYVLITNNYCYKYPLESFYINYYWCMWDIYSRIHTSYSNITRQMKYASCECKKCGMILITFEKDYPKFNLLCPICEKERIKYKKIDRESCNI